MGFNTMPVCVIGAGTMGRGIAQVAVVAGHRVILVDPDIAQLESARAEIAARLERRHPDIVGVLDDRLVRFEHLAHAPAVEHTLVIEAVLEDLAVKREVFEEAHAHFGDTCVLATNTSSLSITEIAAGSRIPERVVGMHFFNPVPLMQLVEVVTGLQTDPQIADLIAELAIAWGKTVARVRSAPGFIVNRVARAFYGEPLRLLEEGAANPETLDEVIRAAGGFKMGPFELMDLIGNDVNSAVTRKVWTAFHFDPRFTPSWTQDELVVAGRYGRKSGHGFYDHAPSAVRAEPAAADGPRPATVSLSGSCPQLEVIVQRAGFETQSEATESRPARAVLPDGTAVVVTRGLTAREEAARAGASVVVIDRCIDPASASGIALAASPAAALEAAAGLLVTAGITPRPIADVPGLVVGRTLSMIANEAFETVLQGIATAADIDVAMELGTNYPVGPFAWCRAWGEEAVLAILDALWETYHDPRYRAGRLLREAATATR